MTNYDEIILGNKEFFTHRCGTCTHFLESTESKYWGGECTLDPPPGYWNPGTMPVSKNGGTKCSFWEPIV